MCHTWITTFSCQTSTLYLILIMTKMMRICIIQQAIKKMARIKIKDSITLTSHLMTLKKVQFVDKLSFAATLSPELDHRLSFFLLKARAMKMNLILF